MTDLKMLLDKFHLRNIHELEDLLTIIRNYTSSDVKLEIEKSKKSYSFVRNWLAKNIDGAHYADIDEK